MKLEKINLDSYKLLKIQLIKSKVYKKKHYFQALKLEDIKYRLKKALYVIYLYHMNNKRILFVGNPLKVNKSLNKILKNTKHLFIPKEVWISGVITNQNTSFKSLLNKSQHSSHKISKRLINLKKKIDLIVILDYEFNNEILKESYLAKIPTITLNTKLDIFNLKSNYKVPGNFIHAKTTITNNFFYSIILATLKRSSKIKQKFPSIPYKLNTATILKKQSVNKGNKFKNNSKWY